MLQQELVVATHAMTGTSAFGGIYRLNLSGNFQGRIFRATTTSGRFHMWYQPNANTSYQRDQDENRFIWLGLRGESNMKMTIGVFIFGMFLSSAFAQEQSCFPIGQARHDRECYDFDEKSSCVATDDIYSCGWGKRKVNPPSDDDILVCDTARCPNGLDGDEEDLQEVE